jgi:exopolyphosphatase/guanosine-5'-triphosphate,3'-diphosphate pyrophosphatase
LKLAAIDIGSNAIRFQVSTILSNESRTIFKKLEYVRFPLRLGHDVFTDGKISPKSAQKFIKLMRAFKLLVELYEVDDYMACATSAMRESENGKEIVAQVEEECGLTVHIIDGHREADLINKAISTYITRRNYLHIDVGGGSTELNVYANGVKTKTRSFKVGSVRVLEHHDSPIMWTDMEKWIRTHIAGTLSDITALGTGGNISKIFELAKLQPGQIMELAQVHEIRAMVERHSLEQRIFDLQMNPDRADVIVPAAEIYTRVMEWAGARQIMVPDVGLKDGIMVYLYEKNTRQKKFVFTGQH